MNTDEWDDDRFTIETEPALRGAVFRLLVRRHWRNAALALCGGLSLLSAGLSYRLGQRARAEHARAECLAECVRLQSGPLSVVRSGGPDGFAVVAIAGEFRGAPFHGHAWMVRGEVRNVHVSGRPGDWTETEAFVRAYLRATPEGRDAP